MDYVWIPAVAVIRLTFSKFQPTTFYHEMKTLLIYFMISKIFLHLFETERARFWRLMAALSLLTAQEWNRCLLFHAVLGFTRLSVFDQKCVTNVSEKSKISRQLLILVLQYCDLEDGQCKFGENFLNRHHPHIFISSYFDKRRCLFKKSECLFRLRRGRRLPWGEVLHLRQPHVPVLEIIVSGQRNTQETPVVKYISFIFAVRDFWCWWYWTLHKAESSLGGTSCPRSPEPGSVDK